MLKAPADERTLSPRILPYATTLRSPDSGKSLHNCVRLPQNHQVFRFGAEAWLAGESLPYAKKDGGG